MASGEKTVETIVKGVIVILVIEWAIKNQALIKTWIDNFQTALQMQTGQMQMMMPAAAANMNMAMVTPVAAVDNTPVTPIAAFDCSKLANCMCIDVGGSCKCQGNSNCSCSSCVAGNAMPTMAAVVPTPVVNPVMDAAKGVKNAVMNVARPIVRRINACGPNTPCGTTCTQNGVTMFMCCPAGKAATPTLSSRVCAMTNRCTVRANGMCT